MDVDSSVGGNGASARGELARGLAASDNRATSIRLFSFRTPQMRAFHMSWVAFFLCFFAWFGMAPLMPIVRAEFQLTQAQIGNIIIASVSITILARLLIGWLCDRYGPRITYAWLLVLGAMPVMGIGMAHDYHTYMFFRLAIGAVGASFVITQYHTSVMFAPNCVGTANATTAGWGNMGGGAAQMLMPLLFAGLVAAGLSESFGWRLAMIVPGVAMLVVGVAYYLLTQDTPQGNVADLRRAGQAVVGPKGKKEPGAFLVACRDHRVWTLAMVYGACFGIEITIHNIAALYFIDSFGAGMKTAGFIVGAFGLLAIFARTLGGILSDRIGIRFGLQGRMVFLTLALFGEGVLLILFSQAVRLPLAAAGLLLFGLFVHISCGATYAVIPFINRKALGSIAGIVGAGGNVGAVLSGFLFRGAMVWPTALLLMGVVITCCALLAILVPFTKREATPEAAVADNLLGAMPAVA